MNPSFLPTGRWGFCRRLDDGSGMSREAHVPFCEGLGVRFPRATHLVVGFQHRGEAERFVAERGARLERFGLSLNLDKTRLIEFGRFADENRRKRGEGKPETFEFLGFTHYYTRTRNGRFFHLARRTAKKRLRATLTKVKAAVRRRMHDPIPEVGKWLERVIVGYYQ